jgi:transcriptional regulator with XRE-family HTH domain
MGVSPQNLVRKPIEPSVMAMIQLVLGNIRAEMARKGLSQTDIGRALGLPAGSISERLADKTSLKVIELLAIADLLNVSPADLVTLI